MNFFSLKTTIQNVLDGKTSPELAVNIISENIEIDRYVLSYMCDMSDLHLDMFSVIKHAVKMFEEPLHIAVEVILESGKTWIYYTLSELDKDFKITDKIIKLAPDFIVEQFIRKHILLTKEQAGLCVGNDSWKVIPVSNKTFKETGMYHPMEDEYKYYRKSSVPTIKKYYSKQLFDENIEFLRPHVIELILKKAEFEIDQNTFMQVANDAKKTNILLINRKYNNGDLIIHFLSKDVLKNSKVITKLVFESKWNTHEGCINALLYRECSHTVIKKYYEMHKSKIDLDKIAEPLFKKK